jgi:hypothetical protein
MKCGAFTAIKSIRSGFGGSLAGVAVEGLTRWWGIAILQGYGYARGSFFDKSIVGEEDVFF